MSNGVLRNHCLLDCLNALEIRVLSTVYERDDGVSELTLRTGGDQKLHSG